MNVEAEIAALNTRVTALEQAQGTPAPVAPATPTGPTENGKAAWPVKIGASSAVTIKGAQAFVKLEVPVEDPQGGIQYRLGANGESDANAQTDAYWSTVAGDRSTIVQVEGAQCTPGSISQSLGNDVRLPPPGVYYLNVSSNRYNVVVCTFLRIP